MSRRGIVAAVVCAVGVTTTACLFLEPLDGLVGGSLDAAGSTDGSQDGSVETDGAQSTDSDAGPGVATCDADLTTDPANCGRCGRSCPTQVCQDADCPVMHLPYSFTIDSLAATDGSVYFGYGGWSGPDGSIGEYTVAGATTPSVVGGQLYPSPLVVRESTLVWATPNDGGVWRANTDGTGVTQLWSGPPPPCLSANSTHVYFVDGARDIVRASLDGGANSATVWQANAGTNCIAASDTLVAYSTSGGLLEMNLATSTPFQVPPPSGDSLLQQQGGGMSDLVAIGGSEIYFATGVGAQQFNVYVVAAGALQPTQIAHITGNVLSSGLVTDGAGVYWTINEVPGGMQGCGDPFCKSGVVSHTSNNCQNCEYIALDSRYVYFGGGNTLNAGFNVYAR
jgi:hypothetical protein